MEMLFLDEPFGIGSLAVRYLGERSNLYSEIRNRYIAFLLRNRRRVSAERGTRIRGIGDRRLIVDSACGVSDRASVRGNGVEALIKFSRVSA
jgi:hypothetical protein